MKEKDFYTLEEIEDEFIGVKGTPKRDKYEDDFSLVKPLNKPGRQGILLRSNWVN